MAGSTFGTLFTVTTWGESHGPALGAVIDGCPSGLCLRECDIQKYLDRRRPGQGKFTTARRENDTAHILSGVFEGRTTGAPLSVMIKNSDQISRDYDTLKSCYRPGHADFTFDQKYGFRDHRGGGRSSGRETIGRVAAGAVASRLLESLGIKVTAYTKSIGPVCVPANAYDFQQIAENPLYMPSNALSEEASAYLETCIKDQDSAGGVIECQIEGLPAGIGEPVFRKLDAALAGAIMSIGAVKAVEIGDGFQAALARGSTNNDAFFFDGSRIRKQTNHSGGILGGLSDGGTLVFRAAVKPTPSISRPQHTVTSDGTETMLSIHGRHDPVIVPRAVVVVEAMASLVLADLLMIHMSSRLESLTAFYRPHTP